MTSAFKFLAGGAVSPFTGFRWPSNGTWVRAASEERASWIFACRARDLPYWVDAELWRVEFGGPIREGRFQISAPRARLAGRVDGWNIQLREQYARACMIRARELALPLLAPELRERVARTEDPAEIANAVGTTTSGASAVAGYLGDTAATARADNPAVPSYITCVLAASLGGGQPAFEAEREWQARWLQEHLGLEDT